MCNVWIWCKPHQYRECSVNDFTRKANLHLACEPYVFMSCLLMQHELDVTFQERGQKGPNMTTISSRYQVCILTNSVCNACYVLLCAGVWLQSVAGCTWGEARPRTLTGGCLLYCVLLPVLYCHRQEKVASRTCAWCQESGEERELLQFSSERALEAWGSPTKLRDKTQL